MDLVFREPMPKGPKILVANHPTISDPFILATLTREPVHIIVWGELFKIRGAGRYLRTLQHIPIDKDQGHRAFETALERLRQGRSVLLFIEGEVSPKNDRFGRPRTGAVRLACVSGAPIVPMGVAVETENIRYSQKPVRGVIVPGGWYFRGRYAVTIGRSFHLNSDVEDRPLVRRRTEDIMKRIKTLVMESKQRMRLHV